MKYFFQELLKPCIIWILGILIPTSSFAQTEHTNQVWSEIAFTGTLPKAWASEINFGQSWTSTPSNKSPVSELAQWYLRGWLYYYPSARWKLGLFLAYYKNPTIEEVGHQANNEIRWALQAIYYIHKLGYTLNTRSRLEFRGITSEQGVREAVTRFRQQIRLQYPFGSKLIRADVFYGIASDEIGVKAASDITGPEFFDRNRLTLGGGYAITDDMQVEMTWANEWLPRTKGTDIINAFQLNFVVNNLFSNIRKHKEWKQKQQIARADSN